MDYYRIIGYNPKIVEDFFKDRGYSFEQKAHTIHYDSKHPIIVDPIARTIFTAESEIALALTQRHIESSENENFGVVKSR